MKIRAESPAFPLHGGGRHKDAIEDMFGIYIECDKKNGYKYYIGNDHVLENDSVQNWLLSTLSVNSIISESLSMQKRILLQSAPAEDGYLRMVIEAMKRSVRIAVDYRKYGTEIPGISTLSLIVSSFSSNAGISWATSTVTPRRRYRRPTISGYSHSTGS